jgi:hypothetical protein
MKTFTLNTLALLAALASTAALAQVAPLGAVPRTPTSPTLAPGLYVSVIDGLINVTNKGGTSNFAAGQFGYTSSFTTPPAPLPRAPTIIFTPPPAFLPSTGSGGTATGNKAAAIDCVVR